MSVYRVINNSVNHPNSYEDLVKNCPIIDGYMAIGYRYGNHLEIIAFTETDVIEHNYIVNGDKLEDTVCGISDYYSVYMVYCRLILAKLTPYREIFRQAADNTKRHLIKILRNKRVMPGVIKYIEQIGYLVKGIEEEFVAYDGRKGYISIANGDVRKLIYVDEPDKEDKMFIWVGYRRFLMRQMCGKLLVSPSKFRDVAVHFKE